MDTVLQTQEYDANGTAMAGRAATTILAEVAKVHDEAETAQSLEELRFAVVRLASLLHEHLQAETSAYL